MSTPFNWNDILGTKDPISDSLRPFQKTGVEFIKKSGYRCLIGDDMRLGKTVQALVSSRENWEDVAPLLILVKAQTTHIWLGECLYWLGKPKKNREKWGRFYQFDPDPTKLPIVLKPGDRPFPGFGIYICSMDSFAKVSKNLQKHGVKIKTIIVDECHNFKNMGTGRTQALHKFVKEEEIKQIICLSGTPILNNAAEFYPTLHLLRPNIFYSERSFIRNWVYITRDNKLGGILPYKRQAFFDLTKNFILRRTKKEVLTEQPKFSRIPEIVTCDDPNFIQVYKQGQKNLEDFMQEALKKGKDTVSLMALLAHLRQTTGIAKIPYVVDAVHDYFSSEEYVPKLLIGVHHHAVGNSLKMALHEKYGAEYLIGGTSARELTHILGEFKNNPEKRVLIASTLGFGEGVDAQFLHTIFQVERQWNVYREKQFEDRMNGMDQKYPMTAIYFMVKNSIDEWFHKLIERKMQWTESALDPKFYENHDNNGDSSVSLWELAEMTVAGKL